MGLWRDEHGYGAHGRGNSATEPDAGEKGDPTDEFATMLRVGRMWNLLSCGSVA